MSEPSEEEINKVIAKFMGFEINLEKGYIFKECTDVSGSGIWDLYTESLDTLILVVERLLLVFDYECYVLPLLNTKEEFVYYLPIACRVDKDPEELIGFCRRSPSLALAMACHKIIKENIND